MAEQRAAQMALMRPNPSIVMTSAPPEGKSFAHPRRPPANRSVSLLHSQGPRKESQSDSSDDGSKRKRADVGSASPGTDSPSSLQALGGKHSSGESSNAEKWFEKSNNEVRDNRASFADNDPPFFMRNSSSSETPPDVHLPQLGDLVHKNDCANSLPLRTGLLHLGTDGSSAEDFRSVIDDLTVENKKLKRRLKKYEKLQDSHLKDEKLFEVRIHGLPPEKKRELEETLRKFTANLGRNEANAFPSGGYSSLLPTLKTSKTTSSHTSLHNADSAYASMSASGQGSIAQSGTDNKKKLTPTQYLAARRQNIHSYLHHIPEGLLPQHNPGTMTERAKKKLVVRRMEQLFAGKGATTGGHQQSIQQQEVSQSAARIDRSVIEASGQHVRQEGSREAHIMNGETEDPLNLGHGKEKHSPDELTVEGRPNKAVQQGFNTRSPVHYPLEQRPTRPLDLDPHRAQVPAENIRYMRQMGFSPNDPQSAQSPVYGHGWIYLNFLINMAQLHTINVTSDFVRKALDEYSNKFEISNDGRRVRWKGRSSVTRASSSGGGSSHNRVSDDIINGQSPRKRPKLTHKNSEQSNVAGGLQQAGGVLPRLRAENSKHSYTPLFFHKDSTDEADDSSSEEDDDNISSPFPVPVAKDSSGRTNSGTCTRSGFPAAPMKKKQNRDDGPIIFYNNARFCTDLSGDRKPNANYKPPMYTTASNVPVGKHESAAEEVCEKRGPLAVAVELPEPMDMSDNPIPESMELSFPPQSPRGATPSNEQNPFDLEVTGIGGVWPADNFAVSVESRHALIDQLQTTKLSNKINPNPLPPRFAQILRGPTSKSKTRPTVNNEIISSKIQRLPPSELPPALSFMPYEEELTDDDESDAEEEASELAESPDALPPAAAPQPVDIPYAFSDENDEDDDDDDDEDEESDGEVDFLATAREIDPEAVREKEREYDANMAERLAEDIPAGSSAATAGGGSGFTSPATGVDRGEYRRAMIETRPRPGLNRAETSDSMVVQGMQDSSSSDSDDEMSNVRS